MVTQFPQISTIILLNGALQSPQYIAKRSFECHSNFQPLLYYCGNRQRLWSPPHRLVIIIAIIQVRRAARCLIFNKKQIACALGPKIKNSRQLQQNNQITSVNGFCDRSDTPTSIMCKISNIMPRRLLSVVFSHSHTPGISTYTCVRVTRAAPLFHRARPAFSNHANSPSGARSKC